MNQDQREKQVKAIFASLGDVETPPFFAARVIAHAKDKRREKSQVWLWRWMAGVAFAAVIALTVYVQTQPKSETLYASKPYVIHVDLEAEEAMLAASAEIELPEGVTFVSKNEDVRDMRRLRLPIRAVEDGPSRLPFVIRSQNAGSRPLQVRLYDANDRLIRVKTLNLHFTEERRG